MFFFFTVGLLRAFNMLLFIGTLIGEGRKVVLFVLFCWQSFLALARYPAQFLPSPPPPGAFMRQVSTEHSLGNVTQGISIPCSSLPSPSVN